MQKNQLSVMIFGMMNLQAKIVNEKIFLVKQELRKEYRGIPFRVRVIVNRGRIDVHISCAEKYDKVRMTALMSKKMKEIALRYSEKTHFTQAELFSKMSEEYVY